MDIFDFYRLVAAVIVANALCAVVFYTFWKASILRKQGLPNSALPFHLILATLIPFAVVFFSVMSLD